MNDLIKTEGGGMNGLITYGDTKITVSGRTLHEWLGVGTKYADWFDRMCEYGFAEGESYFPILGNRSDGLPGKPRTDHEMTLDMAKEVAMLQRTPQGKRAREYFIDVEKKWNSPEMILSRAVKIAEANTKALTAQNDALTAKVAELEPKARFADAVTATDDCVGMSEMAKILTQAGYEIGQNRLFEKCVENRLLFRNGRGEYEPYQRVSEMELFRIVKRVVTTSSKSFTPTTVKVTPKGQKYLVDKFTKPTTIERFSNAPV